jgi:pyruvate/2-oxoglutarate/acetoin dehydrogenase E1 component
VRVASADTPVPCAQNLEAEVLVTTEKLMRAVKAMVERGDLVPAGR